MSTIITDPAAAEGGRTAALRLLSWFSPAFPTGAFSYSHGLEWAVETGLVRDRDTLAAWLQDVLTHGAGWCDALFFCAAHRAAGDGAGRPGLIEVAELAVAFRGTGELALESTAQGRAFFASVRKGWPHRGLDEAASALGDAELTMTLPVAAGLACALHRIALGDGLLAYLHAALSGLVNAGVRLVPLGQSDGLLALAASEAALLETAAAAAASDLSALGSAAVVVDLASMAHETQYTRLFRS